MPIIGVDRIQLAMPAGEEDRLELMEPNA